MEQEPQLSWAEKIIFESTLGKIFMQPAYAAFYVARASFYGPEDYENPRLTKKERARINTGSKLER